VRFVVCVSVVALLAAKGAAARGAPKRSVPTEGYREWKIATGGADGLRYSALAQINRRNVNRLQVAWTYETGDSSPGSEMQCNPIVVDGVLYATSPRLRIIALDAATGRLIWSFHPPEVAQGKRIRNRGVTFWQEGNDRRLFVGAGPSLYALDARTGRPVPGFGPGGKVDMREGLGRNPTTLHVGLNSPPAIYRDLVIVGSVVSEDLPSAPGDVRAYDARTGKLRWTFHTIPRPGEVGHDTWPRDAWTYTGGANNWTGMAVDGKRGLVFVPTGSAAFDFYGANRVGDNLFANCVLALKADTGERVWHFQVVKHDLWDRDLPAPPSLVTVRRKGQPVDAVAQITKGGHVFLFERETGNPLFPIRYRKAPPSNADGEVTADTQPVPVLPPPFARQDLTEDILTNRTPEARAAVLAEYRKLRHGFFQPPSLEGTTLFPGMDGGAEWGGAAFDPESGLLYVNSSERANIMRLVPRKKKGDEVPGAQQLYGSICANCHRADMTGNPPDVASLVGLGTRRTVAQAADIVERGNNRMPAFSFFDRATIEAVVGFIMDGKDRPVSKEAEAVLASLPSAHLKYGHEGYIKWRDPDGYPVVKPPWGTLNAINLDTGKIVWKIPFGEYPDLVAKGLRNTGSENYGGPVVTAGGLVFIGATSADKKFRAYDKATGKLLWQTTLPAAGNATPAVYEVGGRQFVVIAAGGGKWANQSGGSYVAFALPQI
jgi:quinoprotein glucose dehydrogenase